MVLALTGATIAGLLWWVNTSGLAGSELTTARLDAIKIGMSIAIGGGGVFALYLAWRRQRSNEADHVQRERALQHQQQVAVETKAHQERVAEDTRRDALARRVTDLYTKAAEQLGSDKAPVRLAGLYAFERLAQENKEHRQTIVEVLCAYLRMPYDPAERRTEERVTAEERARTEEQQVRLAAQRILTNHVRTPESVIGSSVGFWREVDLDLTGAVLIDFDLRWCRVREARFERTSFVGSTYFNEAEFEELAWFDDAEFHGPVSFNEAEFDGLASFDRARFQHVASFNRARFNGEAWLQEVTFQSGVHCSTTAFERVAMCEWAKFLGDADFKDAKFGAEAMFTEAQFTQSAIFDNVRFGGVAGFDDATFGGEVSFDSVEFCGRIDFDRAKFTNQAPKVIRHLIDSTDMSASDVAES